MTVDEVLVSLVSTLEQLRQIFPNDKPLWDDHPVVRLAVERLWISAGNLAENCRIERGVPTGVDPWSEFVGYRHLLAHALPGDLSPDRVFADTSADLERILEAVRGQVP